jgi:hypothetical protein
MAGSKSNYLENRTINTLVGASTTLTAPSTYWVALWASTMNDTFDAGSTGECIGANYSRIAVTNTTASNWTKATAGIVTNKSVITFTTAASTGWGTVRCFALLDTSSTASGNIWFWGDLSSPQAISAGNVVRFTTGAITLAED